MGIYLYMPMKANEFEKKRFEKRKQLIKLLGRSNYRSLKYSNYDIAVKGDKIILVSETLGFSAIKTMNEAGYDFVYASKKLNSYLIEAIFKKKEVN